MDRLKAVIFDLDGTLVDSMWIWPKIDVEYLGRFGIALTQELAEDVGGMSFTETAVYFKERFHLPDSVERIKEDWNAMALDKYQKEVPLKQGVREYLEWCTANHLRLEIATSNSRQLVESVIRAQGVAEYFDCILTSCEVERGKPAPDIYLEVAKRLGVAPGNCLVFEDIVPGIRAGKAAGMQVCAVWDGGDVASEQRKKELADYYITDYYQAMTLFGPNGQQQ